MVKDIKEFEKLFKLNIPDKKEFQYYIDTLRQSKEYADIDGLVERFAGFEQFIRESGYSSVSHYKMKGAFDILKAYVEGTDTYKRFQEFDYSGIQLHSVDKLKANTDSLMVSFDLRKANYSTMKYFDFEDKEMGVSWENLCCNNNIHPMLAESKSFRQLFFGNLNPKRSQKIQHTFMLQFIEQLKDWGVTEGATSNIIFLSHDEIILRWGDKNMVVAKYLKEFIDANEILMVKTIEKDMTLIKRPMGLKATVFTMEKIPETKVYKKTFFDFEKRIYGDAEILGMKENYSYLWGVPGNKFYMFFKKYILKKEFDKRDLIFFADGQLAKWII